LFIPADPRLTLQLFLACRDYVARGSRVAGLAPLPELHAFKDAWREQVTAGHGGSTLADLLPLPDASPVQPRLLDYQEAAAVLAISQSTLKRLVRSGALPAVRVASMPRIRLSDLDAYVASLTVDNSTTETAS
jgi:excisionase family DNA binding protein